MTKPAQHANSQSISNQMAKGNAAFKRRLIATLKDHSPKTSKFSPATLDFEINQAGAEKTRRISKASI